MKKFFRKFVPHHDTVKSQRWLKPFAHWLKHPNLWHLHRRSAAGGAAIGLFCGLIPGPVQMLSAALLAILLRVNLPVAAFTTLYTNPFTIVPLYLLAYKIGSSVSGAQGEMVAAPFPELQWHNFASEMWDWLLLMGQPLLIGLLLLGTSLAITGYIVVRAVWRVMVLWKWRARRLHRARN
jgi:uncharacterized protein